MCNAQCDAQCRSFTAACALSCRVSFTTNKTETQAESSLPFWYEGRLLPFEMNLIAFQFMRGDLIWDADG